MVLPDWLTLEAVWSTGMSLLNYGIVREAILASLGISFVTFGVGGLMAVIKRQSASNRHEEWLDDPEYVRMFRRDSRRAAYNEAKQYGFTVPDGWEGQRYEGWSDDND